MSLREEFPVFERLAYLNAGTDGPVPRRGADAAAQRLRQELMCGRSGRAHFDAIVEAAQELRRRIAALIGADEGEVALTHSTTDGVNTVLSSLPLGPGDEVVTSDEEHPGLLAPLALARRRKGFDVRFVPFDELAGEVGPRTKLVACSHVSWVGGKVADAAALAGTDAQLLLDGAQGIGAVPVDVGDLGCEFYAASGQKWLCGPDGTGSLYVRAEVANELEPPWPGYGSLADAQQPFELSVHPDARRFDLGISPGAATAWALGALEVLSSAGWASVFERAATLAAALADRLAERGIEVAPRGRSTLVSWRAADPEAEVLRLAEAGIVVRYLPGRDLVRASVGAWSNEDDIERLLAAIAG
jgi:selenocysteine lyase/cysteine desulfurase